MTGYKVAGGKVFVNVAIGDGQIGDSVVFIDDDPIIMGAVNNLELGLGQELVGKILRVKTVATDAVDETNLTSVTWRLSGGAIPYLEGRQKEVENEGDSAVYRARFAFAS